MPQLMLDNIQQGGIKYTVHQFMMMACGLSKGREAHYACR